jgi:hypothetical protein
MLLYLMVAFLAGLVGISLIIIANIPIIAVIALLLKMSFWTVFYVVVVYKLLAGLIHLLFGKK